MKINKEKYNTRRIMKDKVIVWGLGRQIKRLLNSFQGLEEHILFFCDSYPNEKEYHNVPVKRPEVLKEQGDVRIVIATEVYFQEIYNTCICKYHIRKERICSTNEWIRELFEEDELLLRPTSVRLDLCTLCQLNCADCYMRVDNYGTTGKGYVTFDVFRDFVQKNNFIKSIEISNSGEVFLNPDLYKILEYSYEHGISIIIENGTNFNTVSEQLLEALVKFQVKFINFSIDGVSQEIYSIYRRGGNIEKVYENIRKLNEYKEKYQSEYPVLQWQYILFSNNECEVEAASIKAKELNMQMFYKLNYVKEEFKPKNRKLLEKVTGQQYFSIKEYNENNEKMYGSDFCYQTIYEPQINWDGRLLGCCAVWRTDLGINVFEEGLIKALNSAQYREEIACLLGLKEEPSASIPCEECELYHGNIRKGNYLFLQKPMDI